MLIPLKDGLKEQEDPMKKSDLLLYLENQTAFFDFVKPSKNFTSSEIATHFNVKRNTISHYLNQLVDGGELIKINSRPVYFLHKQEFENQFFEVSQTIFSGIEELKKAEPLFKKKEDSFSMLIGHDSSLSRVVQQLKTACFYPDGGLPVLITGESGTGKSHIVRIMYQFCQEKELIDSEAPLVVFNCAQYANNPELLTSNLFGYTKGAFTGAETDHQGAFENANGGILFLDEVHRLNPEGQEKLFTYLDQGMIYRVGDTQNAYPVKTRLVFATTENLDSSFLTTFIRRIPILVEIPHLEKRTATERLELIYSFFIEEQRRIRRDFTVSGQVIQLLKNMHFIGNVGGLRNTIKVAVAKSYAKSEGTDGFEVTIYDLPSQLLVNENRKYTSGSLEKVAINSDTSVLSIAEQVNPEKQQIIRLYERLLLEYQKASKDIQQVEGVLKEHIEELFDYLLFRQDRIQNQEFLLYVTQQVQDTLRQMEVSHHMRFNGNIVYSISYYLFQRSGVYWVPQDVEINELMNHLATSLHEHFPRSFQFSTRLLALLREKLDIEIFEMDTIILTLYISQLDLPKDVKYPQAVIIAHGYATASSITNVANRLLHQNVFESFDMPLDVSPKEIAEQIIEYAEYNASQQGLIILADMGSLKEIDQLFTKKLSTPLLLINNVTTSLALSVGEKILHKTPFEKIQTQVEDSMKLEMKLIYPEVKKRRAILTTCMTGLGTATKISNLLKKSLPDKLDVKIIPIEFPILKEDKQSNSLFSLYDVLCVIGTDNPEIPKVNYISLEELISGKSTDVILGNFVGVDPELKRFFNNNIVRNFSIKKVIGSITILDTDKVILDIELFMQKFEELSEQRVSNPKRLSLFVHISCLIERLIRNVPIAEYDSLNNLRQCREKELAQIKKAFSVIETDYSVKLPDSELAYIHDILFNKLDLPGVDEDF